VELKIKIAARILLFLVIGFILFFFLSLSLFDWSGFYIIIAGVVGGVIGTIISLFTIDALIEKHYKQQDVEEAIEHG